MEGQQLLRNEEIFPSREVLQDALGESVYGILDSLFETISADGYDLIISWRYYKDGKSWLCKAEYKKKTVFWLSVWSGFFKVSFYFTEKHLEAIAELDISETIKNDFCNAKPIGKLIPMTVDMNNRAQLNDILTLIRFKKTLK